MFVESLEKVPEDWRDQFVEVEIDGKKGYQDKDSLALKQLAFNVKEENKTVKSRLSEFEKQQAEKLAEAERKALEKLKAEGKTDEIIADLERRHGETAKQAQERIDRLMGSIKTEKRTAIVADLASELATDSGSKAFKRLVADRIDVDPETGKVTFLNDDGGASSLDLAGFKAELLKDDSFAPLLKAGVVTKGGGNAQGSTGQGGANKPKATRGQFDTMNPAEKMSFIKSGGSVT
jgi:hypothetical protein